MKAGMVALGVLLNLGGGPEGAPSEPPTLYFFFGSNDSDATILARKVADTVLEAPGQIKLRPVLLVEDWRGLTRLRKDSPLVRIFEELKRVRGKNLNLSLFDEEGLRRARHWRITRLPALAVVAGGRAHVAFGNRVDPMEVLKCVR